MNLAEQHDQVQRCLERAEQRGTLRSFFLEAAHSWYDAERRCTIERLGKKRTERDLAAAKQEIAKLKAG